jgi:hypothetical protein
VRNLYHDQSFADRILSLAPDEEQMDVMLHNRFTVAKLGWQPRWFNPDLEKWLHRIKLPGLVVWGDDVVAPAIIHFQSDADGIADELHRIRAAEKRRESRAQKAPGAGAGHRMRATPAGAPRLDLLLGSARGNAAVMAWFRTWLTRGCRSPT